MSYVERVEGLFKANRYRWVRAERLMQVGGICSWRTRVSDVRRTLQAPIENRQRRQGKRIISEYRLGRRRAA